MAGQITFNTVGHVRRERWNGKSYLVAPLAMLNPGVLAGSKGPLLYPADAVKKHTREWDGVPLTVYHPYDPVSNAPLSANDPGVLKRQGVGVVRRPKFDTKLRAEGWFDEEKTKQVSPAVYRALNAGEHIELSTGLYTDEERAPVNAVHAESGRSYVGVVRGHAPDHLAVLPDQVGACSLKDGCGVGVHNAAGPTPNWVPVVNGFCPTGQGGGQDNSCDSKGGGRKGPTPKGKALGHPLEGKSEEEARAELQKHNHPTAPSNDPWGLGSGKVTSADPAALAKTVSRSLASAGGFDRPTVGGLYARAKAEHPKLTLGDFQRQLVAMAKSGEINLHPFTQALRDLRDPHHAFPLDREVKHYVSKGPKAVHNTAASVCPADGSRWEAVGGDGGTALAGGWGVVTHCGGPGSGVPGPCPAGGRKAKKPSYKEQVAAKEKELADRAARLRAGTEPAKPPATATLPDQRPSIVGKAPHEHVHEVVKALAGERNQADLVHVRPALAARGITDRAIQDEAINGARRAGLLSASAYEGRVGGVTPAQREAALPDPGSATGRVGYLHLKKIHNADLGGWTPLLTVNGFCPTGKGGGSDNTCSSRGGGGGGSATATAPSSVLAKTKELLGKRNVKGGDSVAGKFVVMGLDDKGKVSVHLTDTKEKAAELFGRLQAHGYTDLGRVSKPLGAGLTVMDVAKHVGAEYKALGAKKVRVVHNRGSCDMGLISNCSPSGRVDNCSCGGSCGKCGRSDWKPLGNAAFNAAPVVTNCPGMPETAYDSYGRGAPGSLLGEVREKYADLQEQLRERFTEEGSYGMPPVTPMLLDAFPDSTVVYRMGAETYRLGYTETDAGCELDDGDPERVKPATSWEAVGNAEGDAPSDDLPGPKSCQILKDGEVKGHPLTDAQRGMFGAACGKWKKAGGKGKADNAFADGWETLGRDLTSEDTAAEDWAPLARMS